MVRIHFLTLILTITGGGLICIWLPEYSFLLEDESSLVENLTALFYVMAFLGGLKAYSYKKTNKNLSCMARLFPLFISMISILCFFEEISYGIFIWGRNAPYVKFDFESGSVIQTIDGLHDLLVFPEMRIFYWLKDSERNIMLFWALLGMFFCGLMIFAFVYRSKIRKMIFNVPEHLLLTVFSALGIGSLLIDRALIPFNSIMCAFNGMIQEVLEMNASLALIAVCYIQLKKHARFLDRRSA